jgi:hypothetical protein
LPLPTVDEKSPAPAFIERLLRPKTDPWSPITVEEMAQFKPKVEQFESMQDEWQEELKEAAQEEWLKEPLEPVSFLQEAQTKSVWRLTWVRAGLSLVCFCLLAVLGLQIAIHERNRLAVLVPETKYALIWVCELTGCVVSPLQQIESIVIDSSTFSKIRGDTYRLGLVIKNTAPLELALPALELTLTDSQDQPTLRRVFTPAEIGASSKVLAANAEWSTAIALNVRTGAERFTGYRVLAFYP